MKQHCVILHVPEGVQTAHAPQEQQQEALHALANQGTSGILVYRQSPDTQGFPNALGQISQIVGQVQVEDCTPLSDQYKGAKCCLWTSSESVFHMHQKLGFSSAGKLDLDHMSSSELVDDYLKQNKLAECICKHDLLFMHLWGGEGSPERLNSLVHIIKDQYIASDTMFIVLLGSRSEQIDKAQLQSHMESSGKGRTGYEGIYIPRKSFEYSDGQLIEDYCYQGCLLAIYVGRGYVRQDLVQTADFTEALTKGGFGITLATHFLRGIMYYMLKSPKYGS